MHSLYFHRCMCFSDSSQIRIVRQPRKLYGQRQVLTQHRGAARSPGAPAHPAACSPGSSSPQGCAAASCGGCAGWASESAARIAAGSWCWSEDTGGGLRIRSDQKPTATCHWQKCRQRLFQTSEKDDSSVFCVMTICGKIHELWKSSVSLASGTQKPQRGDGHLYIRMSN